MNNNKQPMARWKQITAAVIGNALEWYDFGVFAALAVVISKVFFPLESQYAGLLLTLATFAVGFVTRPIGGILIGMYADRKGRKSALQLVLGIMTLSLLMIILTPSYATIGIAAPIIIVLARLIQGIATGGEFASATAYLVEAAPADKKGRYGSWQMFGQTLANLMGALTGLAMTSFFTQEQLVNGAWRIPFVFGLLIAPVGMWIRRHLEEPEEEGTGTQRRVQKVSLAEIFATFPRQIIGSLMLTTAMTASVYAFVIYLPTYASRQFNFPLHDAYAAQVIGLFALLITVPIMGWLTDKYGRQKIILSFFTPYLILSYPLFHWVQVEQSFLSLVTTYVILSTLFAGMLGPFSTTLGEQFPRHVRSTGLAICYNIAVMIFGGFAQMIVTWLIQVTGLVLAPVLYAISAGVLGIIACFILPTVYRPQRESRNGSIQTP